jgi:transcriptional regulator with XRE-family HTH domain
MNGWPVSPDDLPGFPENLESLSPAHARLLGMLASARRLSGKTIREAAADLDWSPSKLHRLEQGKRKPPPAEVRDYLRVLGVDDSGDAVALADQIAAEAQPWTVLHRDGAGRRQALYAQRDAEASAISVFQPVVVPGLAQVDAYAARIGELFPIPAADLPAFVAARMARQQVLYSGKPVTMVITEPALRLRVATPAVMVQQLDRLTSIASLEHVTVAVVPIDAPAPALPLGSFVLLDFDDGTGMVTVEAEGAEVEYDAPEDVERWRHRLELWRKAAVTGQDALGLLARVRAGFA